jgi:MFS family permease
MRVQLTGLWRHPDFLKLWAGQTVSLFGSLIGRFALPLVAVLTLEASPAQVALLQLAEMAPGPVVGLVAGAWVDRLRRRPLMLWADVGRALLLATIPAAAVLGALRVEHLYFVAVLVGTLSTVFDVAYQSYLPTLLRREALVEGNSKLQASAAVAEVGSFGVAGALVQALTAPVAILADALSFVVSAASLVSIRTREPAPAPPATREAAWREIRQGLAFVLASSVLRPLVASKATHDSFLFVWVAMLMLFLTRELALPPLLLGALFAIGGLSALAGAVAAERVVRRWGLGRALIGGLFLSSLSLLFVPLAAGPLLLVVTLVGAQQLFDGPATIYEINEASLIQATTPHHLLGRVAASLRVVGWAAMLVGVLAGGLLGELIGPRTTMLVGALGTLPAALWLLRSPIRTLRMLPGQPTITSG